MVEIMFQDKVKDKMYSNNSLKKFIFEIESVLKTLSNSIRNEIKSNLKFEKDYEIPDLENLILSIDIKDTEFELKLQLWDQLDQMIRTRIYQNIDESSEPEKSFLAQMNENFIIKLDPL